MKKWLPHIGIVLGVCVALYALFGPQGEEELIRQQLSALEDTVEVHASGENIVLRAARIKKAFSRIFTKDVAVRIPEVAHVKSGRGELSQLASQAPRVYQSASIDLSGLSVELDDSQERATAFGDARFEGVRSSGSPMAQQRTVSLRLDKIDNDWRIVSLTVSLAGEVE